MNCILQLKGKFEQGDSSSRYGPSNMPKNKYVTVEHLNDLKLDLLNVREFWKNENEKLLINPLISVYYTDVVAKSNRIKGILENSQKNNNTVVGAKFTSGEHKKHIITHCVLDKVLKCSIENIEKVIIIIRKTFGDKITYEDICNIHDGKYRDLFNENKEISKTRFIDIVVDSFFIEKFGVEKDTNDFKENAIITIYDTGIKTSDILEQLDINILDVRSIDETTILLTPDQYDILKTKAPYLISMAVSDISLLEKEDILKGEEIKNSIPSPGNEPTIGVIDTMFDENVYFSEWVEFKNMLNEEIKLTDDDYRHGTMVTSIIVDGANINPNLDDGCGRFKVRHFGVATSGRFSSFAVLKAIKEIVITNRDIKVWNLSLGSSMEINPNFISPEAAILDKIQYENNVVFVIAGTNKPQDSSIMKIGAPADSINSLVVNSVDFNNKPTNYTREGLVLSFFNKPDVSYYGGDEKKKIRTCTSFGEAFVSGTSFAAPWITRKMAYLIEILGLTRELAKALIIDSAAGWSKNTYSSKLIGYGVVPVHINDIIKTPDDEIKFLISGESKKFHTYNYNIPIPEDNQRQPFVSKATLCYFPKCSRNQGVDYTNTEMDIHFGRVNKTKNGKWIINSINDNKQSNEEKISIYEKNARESYRKWDNVKHIGENIKTQLGKQRRPKKIQLNGLWGISIKTKERLNYHDGDNLKFGLVVTLKEVNGVNRMQEFCNLCNFRGWFVNKIIVEDRVDIYNVAEQEIEFE